jgi:hypothetical protein
MFMRNPTSTSKPTGFSSLLPLLLLFILGCAITIFVLVVRMTLTRQAASSTKDAPASVSPVLQPKEPPRQAVNTKKKDRATAVPGRRSSASGRIHTTVSSSTADQNDQALNVKTDSTPVFQSNSANSVRVTSLQKGDEVKSGGIQIIDPNGSWTLVRGAGRSGFVPSESLEPKTSVEQAQK